MFSFGTENFKHKQKQSEEYMDSLSSSHTELVKSGPSMLFVHTSVVRSTSA